MGGDAASRKFEIFDRAADLNDLEQQQALLDELCGSDARLRAEVEDLLSHAGKLGSFLDQPPSENEDGSATRAMPPSIEAGTQIGRYQLLEQIGQGGMGTVYLARQSQPVKRRVALKLIKSHVRAKEIIGRFEAERQALALMEHPHIARFFDAGSTTEGDPYFVMEYVAGTPVTTFCDEHRFSIRQRLELFRAICMAVQHAHQKGIIHRDLKPSNILVTMVDDQPVPKIIDFGLAKATGGQLADQTVHTHFGQVLGTLQYMSPEQTLGNQAEVDTRSDIYSLGAILYELLVGSPPFEKSSFKDRPIDEVVKMIREDDPQTPTRRFDSCETNDEIAQRRQLDPAKLFRTIRGDLEWIVIKSLAKDRSRRYQTANEFSDDLLHYLEDRPVKAGPPSLAYNFSKFLKRNRVAVGFAATVAIGLLALITTLAVANNMLADRADGERLAKEASQKRLAQVEKSNDVLASVFQDLDFQSTDGYEEPLESRLGSRLLIAASQLDEESIGDSAVVADVQYKLAGSLNSLGFHEEAIELARKSKLLRSNELGPDHPDTLLSEQLVALGLYHLGEKKQAIGIYEKMEKSLVAVFGEKHPRVAQTRGDLGAFYRSVGETEIAIEYLEDSVTTLSELLGENHKSTIGQVKNLANAYHTAAKFDKAIASAQRALGAYEATLGLDHFNTLLVKINLSVYSRAAGQIDQATRIEKEVFNQATSKLGSDHPLTITAANNLASGYMESSQWNLAIPVFERLLRVHRNKFGDAHEGTLTIMNQLACCYLDIGELEKSLPLLEEVVMKSSEVEGDDHLSTIVSGTNLALCHKELRNYDKAKELNLRYLEHSRKALGDEHPASLRLKNNLAGVYRDNNQIEEAIPLLMEVLASRKAVLGADHPDSLNSMYGLGFAYYKANQLDLAVPLLVETLALQESKLGRSNLRTMITRHLLGLALLRLNQFEEAITVLQENLKHRQTVLGPTHARTFDSITWLAYAHRKAEQPAAAIPLLSRALELSQQLNGIDHRQTITRKRVLAITYLEANQVQPALPLFRDFLKSFRAKSPDNDVSYAHFLDLFSSHFLKADEFAIAEKYLFEAYNLRKERQHNDWLVFNTRSLLGEAISGQQKFDEAEQHLIESAEGMLHTSESPPKGWSVKDSVALAIDRIIKSYDAWHNVDSNGGYDEKSATWKEKLEERISMDEPASIAEPLHDNK